MSSYKTDHPKVLETWAAINKDYAALQVSAHAFFAKFGSGKVCFTNGLTSIDCLGFVFNEKKDPMFWTKPDRESGIQRPRERITGATKEQRQEHKELLAAWSSIPKGRVDLKPLYESFGSDWGNLYINGLAYLEGADGFLYVKTGARLGEWMESIPDWEFAKAKEEKKGGAS